jgi:hypothetical protein
MYRDRFRFFSPSSSLSSSNWHHCFIPLLVHLAGGGFTEDDESFFGGVGGIGGVGDDCYRG